jgi:hypothetical protein
MRGNLLGGRCADIRTKKMLPQREAFIIENTPE